LAEAPSDHHIPFQAGQSFERRIYLKEPVIDREIMFIADDLMEGKPFSHLLEQVPEFLFTFPEPDFRQPSFGDIVHHTDGADDPAGLIPQVLALLVDVPDPAVVFPYDPVLYPVAVLSL